METENRTNRASTVIVVMLMLMASMFMLVAYSPSVTASVTTGSTANMVSSTTPYIRDDSTAIPIFAFGAESDVANDRLSRVEVTIDVRDIDTGELESISTDANVSGVAIVRDDGDTDDAFDANDTPVDVSSINWMGGWPYNTVRLDMNALINELVPQTLSGSYQWFVVVRTDWDADNGDFIDARIYSNGIDFSDGSSQPASTVYANYLYVRETEFYGMTDGYMIPSEAKEVLALDIVDGGDFETFDYVSVSFLSISGWTLSDLATVTTSASTSGIAIYRNDNDNYWDSGDVGVDCTSVDTSSWPTVYLYPDSEELPDSPQTYYEYWIVLRTSSTAGHTDRFYVYGGTSSISINGTLNVSADRGVMTPESGNSYYEYIQVDARDPYVNWYQWNEGSSYLHYTGGTLWFNPAVTWTQSATLRVSASDSWTGVDWVYFSYEASLASGGYYDYSSIYEYTYNFDSTDTDASAPITLTLEDVAGNQATYDVRYGMDTTAPAVTIVSPTNLDTLSGVVTIMATATDTQATVRYNSAQVSWDGGWSWYSMPWDGTHFKYNLDTTLLADGQYRIVVRVYDEVSNAGTSFVNVWTDNTGPVSYIVWPTSGQYVHSANDLTVAAVVSDFSSISTAECRIGTGAWQGMAYDAITGTWQVDMGAPGAGNLIIQVRATDSEGNLGPVATVIAIGDANDPTVSIVSHASGDEVSDTITIKVDADDAEALSFVKVWLVSGGTTLILDAVLNPITGYYEVNVDTTQLADGTWTMAAAAFDEAGRYSTTPAVTFVVDNTEPTLALSDPTNGEYVWGTVTITAVAQDTGSGMDNNAVALSVDGGAWSLMTAGGGGQYSYDLDTTGLSDGQHVLTVAAMDDAGNVVVRMVTFVVDNTRPMVAVVAPSAEDFVEGMYTFAVSAVDNMGLANVSAVITGPGGTYDVALGYNAASGYYEWTSDTRGWADGTYTIKPYATELSGRPYTSAGTVTFTVDNTMPSLVIGAPMDGEVILLDTYTVTATADDMTFGLSPGDVEWRVDANPWADMNAGGSGWSATWFTSDYADGVHTLSFRVTDAAGHVVVQTIRVTVDNTDPLVSLNTPSVGEYVEGVYTFSARATDSLGVRSVEMDFGFSGPAPLSTAQATYNPSTGYWELKVDTHTLPDGPASIQLTATDTSGRMTVGGVIDFAVDNNEPALLLLSPTPGEIVLDGTLSVLVNASDEGFTLGTGDVEYSLDGTGWIGMGNLSGEPALWGFDLDTSSMADGTHSMAFRVTDMAGHVTGAQVMFTVDNNDPVASIVAPASGEFAMGVYWFRVAASDALGIDGVDFSFEGIDGLTDAAATFNPASGLWEFLIDTRTLDDTEAGVTAVATDGSGRTSEVAGPVSFVIDNHAPIVTFTTPAEGEILTEGQHTITVSAVDSFFDVEYGMVTMSIDGGSWMVVSKDDSDFVYDWNTSMLTDGPHNLMVRATDRAGHTSEASINVIVDNNDPSLAIVSPTNGQFVTGPLNFQVASSDARGIRSVTLSWSDGGQVLATLNAATNYYEYGLDTTTLVDGTYTLTARATDGSGLISEATVEFNVDNTEPELVFEGPLSGAILFDEVTVTATATDTFIDSLQFSVDGVGWVDMVDGSGTFDSTGFADGEHVITVRAIDGSGKVVSAESVVTIDNNAPLLSVADFPAMDEHLAGERTFAVFSDDTVGVDAVTVAVGDEDMPVYVNPATGFYEWTLHSTDYADGQLDLVFTSVDAAGHSSSVEWSVFVDNTAPLIVEQSPKSGSEVKEIVHFEVLATDDTGIESVMLRIGHGPWITMTLQDDGTYLYKWETTGEDDQEDLDYTVRVTDDLGNTEDTTYNIDVNNPMSMVWIVLAVILIVLIGLVLYFYRQKEAEGSEGDEAPDEELEEIHDDLDGLLELGSVSSSGGTDVEVELEEKDM